MNKEKKQTKQKIQYSIQTKWMKNIIIKIQNSNNKNI